MASQAGCLLLILEYGPHAQFAEATTSSQERFCQSFSTADARVSFHIVSAVPLKNFDVRQGDAITRYFNDGMTGAVYERAEVCNDRLFVAVVKPARHGVDPDWRAGLVRSIEADRQFFLIVIARAGLATVEEALRVFRLSHPCGLSMVVGVLTEHDDLGRGRATGIIPSQNVRQLGCVVMPAVLPAMTLKAPHLMHDAIPIGLVLSGLDGGHPRQRQDNVKIVAHMRPLG